MLGYSLFLFVNYLPAPTCNSQAAKLYDQALSSNRAETIMLNTPEESLTHAQLRQRAELRLRGGIAPPTQGWTIGAASLSLLHRLASDPATAADALKLLHELQVHQVELDLQHEHMDEERQAQEQSANRLADLFISAPIAYFVVNSTGTGAIVNIDATAIGTAVWQGFSVDVLTSGGGTRGDFAPSMRG